MTKKGERAVKEKPAAALTPVGEEEPKNPGTQAAGLGASGLQAAALPSHRRPWLGSRLEFLNLRWVDVGLELDLWLGMLTDNSKV